MFESCSPRRHRERIRLGEGCGGELPVRFQLRLLHGSDRRPPQPAVAPVLTIISRAPQQLEMQLGSGEWDWAGVGGSDGELLSRAELAPAFATAPTRWHWGWRSGAALHVAAHVCTQGPAVEEGTAGSLRCWAPSRLRQPRVPQLGAPAGKQHQSKGSFHPTPACRRKGPAAPSGAEARG